MTRQNRIHKLVRENQQSRKQVSRMHQRNGRKFPKGHTRNWWKAWWRELAKEWEND